MKGHGHRVRGGRSKYARSRHRYHRRGGHRIPRESAPLDNEFQFKDLEGPTLAEVWPDSRK